MSLTIFNGSPRGKAGNSEVIAQWFLEGYGPQKTKTHYLNSSKSLEDSINSFIDSNNILMVFPLYVDGMPGQVKGFLEALLPHGEKLKGKHITFVIHSGFSEGIQNRGLESYLKGFARHFHMVNHGVIIIPGSEGLRMMPAMMTKNKHQALNRAGHAFSKKLAYDEEIHRILNPREITNGPRKLLFRLLSFLGLTNMYWNSNLKKNGAYEKRFEAPYSKNPVPITTQAYTSNKN